MLATIKIDGQKLKAAREAKGQSILEMAASLTLSRDQIKYIEEGGDKAFYTPAHKLLAVRKYANSLGIPYEEVVTGEGAELTVAAPEDAPAAMHTHIAQPAVASDLRLAAVARNANIRRTTLAAGVILCIMLALYAKVRGSDDDVHSEEEQTSLTTDIGDDPKQAEPASLAAVASASTENSNNNDDCPQEQTGTEPKTWSPAYQRKSDPKLYLISPRGGSLCVADVSGHAKRISLKPMVGQTISGKPPYTVRAENLTQIEMYMQGLRVKVPDDANVLRLIPTRNTLTQPAQPATAKAPDA